MNLSVCEACFANIVYLVVASSLSRSPFSCDTLFVLVCVTGTRLFLHKPACRSSNPHPMVLIYLHLPFYRDDYDRSSRLRR